MNKLQAFRKRNLTNLYTVITLPFNYFIVLTVISKHPYQLKQEVMTTPISHSFFLFERVTNYTVPNSNYHMLY